MFVVAVANLKGGTGKTTVATHLAAAFAVAGHRTVLGDLDKLQVASAWARRRGAGLARVEAVTLDADEMVVPIGPGRTVIDVPAGMKRKALEVVVRAADAVVVPVQPGPFDEAGIERFLEVVREFKPVRKGRRPIAVVGNRVRARTSAAARLDAYLAGLDHPAVTRLSDAQAYLTAALTGQTVFDAPPRRANARQRDEWAPLVRFLDDLALDTAHADL